MGFAPSVKAKIKNPFKIKSTLRGAFFVFAVLDFSFYYIKYYTSYVKNIF